MKYMGSKSRIAKDIVPIIQQFVDGSETGVYYEPFCGGCNVIEHIRAGERYVADRQRYLIALLQNLHRLEELPETVSKAHYDAVRDCCSSRGNDFDDWYIGAIGFLASYNGRFFDGGYAGTAHTKAGTIRDYYAEARRNLEAQAPALSGIQFACADYREGKYIPGSVIYCDPPYKGVKQYGSSKDFDHAAFWDWVREMSAGHVVIVSEQQAPEDAVCIWSHSVKRTIDNNKRSIAVEKLWRMEGTT